MRFGNENADRDRANLLILTPYGEDEYEARLATPGGDYYRLTLSRADAWRMVEFIHDIEAARSEFTKGPEPSSEIDEGVL